MINQILTNPEYPDRHPAYIYVKAAENFSKIRDSSSTVVIYESIAKWTGGVNIGFADGHVEFISDHKKVAELLKLDVN